MATSRNSTNIQVVCRFRPQNNLEKQESGSLCVALADEQVVLNTKEGGPYTFNFDKVFGMGSTQPEVYDYVGIPIVQDIFNGYNGTIFVYGQTGAGKSFTMMGPNTGNGYCDDDILKGLIPRIVQAIFKTVENSDENLEFTIQVSYIEIYLEKIRDLFNPANQNLQIKEDRESGRGVFVAGVKEEYVTSAEDVFELMKDGAANRIVSSTRMNAESSRSHSIFIITINQKDTVKLESKTGKLFLVDLAGSEKVSKTGAAGQQLEEAKNINKSLSSLGNVINALTDGKSTHIPYRDSKLTRLLQDSLGGNSRTTLIINCSPSTYNDFETLSTLRFGMRAKSIKNKPRVNKELSARELQLLLTKAEKEIERLNSYITSLESQLSAYKGSGAVPSAVPVSHESSTSNDEDATDRPLSNISAFRVEMEQLEAKLKQEEEEKNQVLEERDSLQEQLQEKREEIAEKIRIARMLESQMNELRENEAQIEKENEFLVHKLADVTFMFEKAQFEANEKTLNLESLTAANAALTNELAGMKEIVSQLRTEMEQQLMNKSLQQNPTLYNILSSWEKDKEQKMIEEKEFNDTMNETISQLQHLQMQPTASAPTLSAATSTTTLEDVPPPTTSNDASVVPPHTPEVATVSRDSIALAALEEEKAQMAIELAQLRTKVAEQSNEIESLKAVNARAAAEDLSTPPPTVEPVEEQSSDNAEEVNPIAAENQSLQQKIKELLTVHSEEIAKLKQEHQSAIAKLESSHSHRVSHLDSEHERTERERSNRLIELDEECQRLRKSLEASKQATIKQRKEFDQLKEALLKDLQNRCEKVIDLEMSLDEARDQYKQLLITSSNKTLKKKLILLERSLEQLTASFQQTYNENSNLKLELQLAEKKLAIRNDRIHNLEFLLDDAKEKNKSHADEKTKIKQENEQLKTELQYLQETVKQLTQQQASKSAAGNGSAAAAVAAAARKMKHESTASSRIVKPLRGGGGKNKLTNDGVGEELMSVETLNGAATSTLSDGTQPREEHQRSRFSLTDLFFKPKRQEKSD